MPIMSVNFSILNYFEHFNFSLTNNHFIREKKKKWHGSCDIIAMMFFVVVVCVVACAQCSKKGVSKKRPKTTSRQ